MPTLVKHQPHGSTCPPCSTDGPFLRNHYFTGKLLVERDFTEEQGYHVGKLRHHNHRLHGYGVVCGLRVHAHPDPACRDRYVCIEPGSAIDCCGREIVLRDHDVFGRTLAADEPSCAALVDLESFDEVLALAGEDPQQEHTLQIAVCYKECGTEDIPVLYDECGCDGARCEPNRLLESHEVKVIVDPVLETSAPGSVELKWRTTIGVTGARHVVLNESGRVLYIMTVDEPIDVSKVYVVCADNHAVKSCLTFDGVGLAMRISPDDASLYIARQVAGDAAGLRELLVYDTADLDAAPSSQTLPNTAASGLMLATADATPDRLYVLAVETQRLQIWARTGVDAITVSMESDLDTATDLRDLDVSSDGATVYALEAGAPDSHLVAIDVTDPTTPSAPVQLAPGLPSTEPVALAVVRSSATDLLVALGRGADRVYLVDPATATLIASADLEANHEGVDLVIGPGGQWAYVLMNDTTTSVGVVAALNLHLLQSGSIEWSDPLPLGTNANALAITNAGGSIFVPYSGDPADECDGGVAVIDVIDRGCCEMFWSTLDGCKACDEDCVVLATIENYRPGFAIEDVADDPAPTAAEDLAAEIARLNNRLGRRLLPSTQLMAEMLECLCARGEGGHGPMGPQGPPGQPGPGIDDIVIVHHECDEPMPDPLFSFDPGTRILTVHVQNGCDGDDGDDGAGITDVEVLNHPCVNGVPAVLPPSDFDADTGVLTIHVRDGCDGAPGTDGTDGDDGAGLETGLTQIMALSWDHNAIDSGAFVEVLEPGRPSRFGLVIAFTKPVRALLDQTLNLFNHVFELQIPLKNTYRDSPLEFVCWCPLVAEMALVQPLIDETTDPEKVIRATKVGGPRALGLALLFDPEQVDEYFRDAGPIQFRVKLRCDFVVDDEDPELARAVDGEFPRAELLSGDRPRGEGHGIQGGTFISWFTMRPYGQGDPIFNPLLRQQDDDPVPGGDPSSGGVNFRPGMSRTELFILAGVRDARATRILRYLEERPIRDWDDLQAALGMRDQEFATFRANNKDRIRFN